MHFRVPITILACCIACTLILPAAASGSRATGGLKHTFSFSPHPGERAEQVNAILQMLAEGSGRLRAYTAYTCRVTLQLQDTAGPGQVPEFRIVPDAVYLEGDTRYRHFSLSDLLMPDKADFRFVLYDMEGKALQSWQFAGIDMPSAGEVWFTVAPGMEVFAEAAGFGFADVELYYDEQALQRIFQWRQALASYYKVPDILARVAGLAEGLDPSNPRSLLLEEFRLCEAEALMGEIRYAPFREWDNVLESDPSGILPKYARLEHKVSELRASFNRSLASLDSLYYRKGIEAAGARSPDVARDMFLSAVGYNPFHIPSHLALAEADLESGQQVAALHRLARVFSVMHPEKILREQAVANAGRVLDTLFGQAGALMEEGRHTASLETLSHAERFCEETRGHYPCPPELHVLLSESHYGIYASYLTVAGRALRNDDIHFARMFAENAIGYQEQWRDHVASPREGLALLFRVFTRSRTLAELFRLLGEPSGTDRYLVPARGIAIAHPGLFDFVMESGSESLVREGVLNYAVAGMPANSVLLLRQLRDMGADPSSLAYHQKVAGEHAAIVLSAGNAERDPWPVVRELTGGDPWFRAFEQAFAGAWQQ